MTPPCPALQPPSGSHPARPVPDPTPPDDLSADPESPIPDHRPSLPLAALHDALDILAAEWDTDL
jgi:hypothetical protein